METPSLAWRAVYCMGYQEAKARDGLMARGLEVFFPYERVTRRVSTRAPGTGGWKLVTDEVALFANYLFVNSDLFQLIKAVTGVLAVVCSAGKPLYVPDRVISKLRSAAGVGGLVSSKDITKNSFWFEGKVGDRFQFKEDTLLAGLAGRISSLANLDETGEIQAYISMLGCERELAVPHEFVGHILCAGHQDAITT